MRKAYPLYHQIFTTLKNEILSGIYKAGASFPTEAEIMERFSSSRTTVRNALKLLHEEGMIISKRGSGTIVCSEEAISTHIIRSRLTDVTNIDFYYDVDQPWEEESSEAIIDTVLADRSVAKELEIPLGTAVYRIRWLMTLNGVGYNFLTNYLRMDLFPNLETRIGKLYSLYRQLAAAYDIHFTHGREEIQPMCASFIEASFLHVPEGKALMKLCRTAYCEQGPLEYSESIINPDILRISLTLTPRVSTKNAYENG